MRRREEAIDRGVKVAETRHSMKRRKSCHDYHRKGTYMLTLVVEGREPLFGVLDGQVEADAGTVDAPRVRLSALGQAIMRDEVAKIHRFYPMVEVWKVCIMPDHIHMIVRVKEDMGEGKTLGRVVRGFKTGCSRAWWRLAFPQAFAAMQAAGAATAPEGKASGTVAGSRMGIEASHASGMVAGSRMGIEASQGSGMVAGSRMGIEASQGSGTVAGSRMGIEASQGSGTVAAPVRSAFPECSPASQAPAASPSCAPLPRLPLLFESGYNDKILMREGQLDNWKAYLDDNPRRLLVKRRFPQLFTVLQNMEIAGRQCQMVGNRFLLDIPDKVAVIVHRRYTDEECDRLCCEWLACGERGGVLVSAAISPKEKAVLREAMNRGLRIILLRENGFPKMYKPSGESFDACSEGLLLQISPWEYHMDRRGITRSQCLELNTMAETIAESSFTACKPCTPVVSAQ